MIRVVLSGGLGNQLFQYALGRHLSFKYDRKLVLDGSLYGKAYKARLASLLHFDLKATIPIPPLSMYVRKIVGKQLWELFSRHTFFEKGYGFDDAVLAKPGVRTVVGYFQSEKYFAAIGDIIRRDLTLRDLPISPESARLIDDIQSGEAVSVHVRRGDYLTLRLFRVCSEDYYARAIDYFRERLARPRFYFFSDDIQWCRDSFRGTEFVFCDLDQSRAEPTNDLRLMSMCTHNIIANSTFSWWAAWLNSHPNRIVLCPYIWLNNRPDYPIDDIIPNSWIKVVFRTDQVQGDLCQR